MMLMEPTWFDIMWYVRWFLSDLLARIDRSHVANCNKFQVISKTTHLNAVGPLEIADWIDIDGRVGLFQVASMQPKTTQ